MTIKISSQTALQNANLDFDDTNRNTVTRSPVDTVVPGGMLTLFIVFITSVSIVLYFLVVRYQEAERIKYLLHTAQESSESLSHFREFYSKAVVSRVAGSDIVVSHDYQSREHAIPLPATMSIDFGKFLEQKEQTTSFRMLSDFPFPWRSERKIDEFERKALDFLKRNPGETFYEFEIREGQRWLRYATPVKMAASCVECHNSHPDSTFRAWKEGDVRGIQEVLLPEVSQNKIDSAPTKWAFNQIIAFGAFAFLIAMCSLILLGRANRRAFARLDHLAKIEKAERKEIAQAKSEVEEGLIRLRSVLNNANDAILTMDPNGRIETANFAAEHMFGYAHGELIGSHFSRIIPIKGANMLEGLTGVNKGEQAVCIGSESFGSRSDGGVFPLEISISEVQLGERTICTAIIRDITERKESENALRSSEEQARKLSMVAAHTNNAVIITDAQGNIEWTNDSFSRISGYSMEEVLGKKPGKILQGPETSSAEVEYMRSALEKGEGFNVEILNYRKDGTQYWLAIEAKPILDENGTVQQFIAIEQDITESRRYACDLEVARENAEQANMAKSKFLAMISHEIRTPLNGVLGTFGLLEDTKLDKLQRKYSSVGKQSAQALLNIINDILDFSRLESGKLSLEEEVFHMPSLIQGVVDLLLPRSAEKGITLRAKINEEVPSNLLGDSGKLRQILINLAGNAVKFTQDGHVQINVSLDWSEDDIQCLQFSVIDSGVGISKEDQEHLFDEFWTLSHAYNTQGTGLGLAISKGFVSAMKGQLTVESTLGVGSRFSFAVPLQRAGEDSIFDHEKEIVQLEKRFDGRVLLAEDNTANQMIAVSMLNRLGLKVEVANNGLEAVESVRARPYDLILMDIGMPELDGVKATHAIRELPGPESKLPIVAMTAHVMRGDKEKLLQEGIDGYIGKPFSKAELIEVLKSYLSETKDQIVEDLEVEDTGDAPVIAFSDWVDEAILYDLFKDTGEDMAPALVDVFIQELDERVEALKQAISNSDLLNLAEQAHAIKSSSASYGAMKLSNLAQSMESFGDNNDSNAVLSLTERFLSVVDETKATFLGFKLRYAQAS